MSRSGDADGRPMRRWTESARTGNRFFVQDMGDSRALLLRLKGSKRRSTIYRSPVYLSHSLAKAVRLLRKSSQSSGISNLIFSRGSPPGGGTAPCLAE